MSVVVEKGRKQACSLNVKGERREAEGLRKRKKENNTLSKGKKKG